MEHSSTIGQKLEPTDDKKKPLVEPVRIFYHYLSLSFSILIHLIMSLLLLYLDFRFHDLCIHVNWPTWINRYYPGGLPSKAKRLLEESIGARSDKFLLPNSQGREIP